MKKALIVAIDNYPGTSNDLNECLNDAKKWCGLFNKLGFDEIIQLYNDAATKDTILFELQTMILDGDYGDELVFCYSGHGTQVVDVTGDENDRYDEALYVYDGIILDDELRDIFNMILKTNSIAESVNVTCLIDSCFSGTVTRLVGSGSSKKIRFIPPDLSRISDDVIITRKKRLLGESDMEELLMSAASDTQPAYDGVFTPAAVELFKKGISYDQWHTEISNKIGSKQTPQLEGSFYNKSRAVFGVVGNEDEQPDLPADDKKASWLAWVVAGGIIVLFAVMWIIISG